MTAREGEDPQGYRDLLLRFARGTITDRERDDALLAVFGRCSSSWRGLQCKSWSGHPSHHSAMALSRWHASWSDDAADEWAAANGGPT